MLNPLALAAAGILALAAPAAAPAVPAVPAVPASAWTMDEVPASLDWEVKPTRDIAAPAGSVDFDIGYHTEHHSSNWGRTVQLSSLTGLTEAQLASAGQPVSFLLRHDAGDFRCTGVAGQGKAVGSCAYVANPAFAGELARRGVTGGLTPYQQFELSRGDVGIAYLDELKRENYATPSAEDLAKAATHGAGLKQLLAMNAAGYRFGDVATFVHARDHGVSARYIEALRDAGYTRLSGADLVHMRDHGVSATFIGELRAAGAPHYSPDDLVRLRDHGVSSAYITELRAAGYAGLSTEDIIHMRDHGVSAGFVAELRALGYDRVPAEQLARLRDHGVSPSFIRTANEGAERLSPEDLIRLRDRGGRHAEDLRQR